MRAPAVHTSATMVSRLRVPCMLLSSAPASEPQKRHTDTHTHLPLFDATADSAPHDPSSSATAVVVRRVGHLEAHFEHRKDRHHRPHRSGAGAIVPSSSRRGIMIRATR